MCKTCCVYLVSIHSDFVANEFWQLICLLVWKVYEGTSCKMFSLEGLMRKNGNILNKLEGFVLQRKDYSKKFCNVQQWHDMTMASMTMTLLTSDINDK